MSSGSGSGSGADQHLLALLRAIRLRQTAPDAAAAGAADVAAALTEHGLSGPPGDEPEHPTPLPGTAHEALPPGVAREALPPGAAHEALPPGAAREALPPAPSPTGADHGPVPAPDRAGRGSATPTGADAAEVTARASAAPSPYDHGPQLRPSGLPPIEPTHHAEGVVPAPPGGPFPAPERGGSAESLPTGRAGAAGLRPTSERAGRGEFRAPERRGNAGLPTAPDAQPPEVGRPSRNLFAGLAPVRRRLAEASVDPAHAPDPAVADPMTARPRWASPGAPSQDRPGALPPRGLDPMTAPLVTTGRSPATMDGMDPADDVLLRETQRLLSTSLTFAGGPGDVAERLRDALLQAHPGLLAALPGDARMQTELLAQALTWLVHHLDRPPILVAGCGQLGAALAACGVEPEQLQMVGAALAEAMRAGMPPGVWRQDFDLAWRSTWQHAYEWIWQSTPWGEPTTWTAVVVGHDLRRDDLAVVRLRPYLPMPFRPGQYARVEVPALPGIWRPYSLAGAPRRDNVVELHVRAKTDGGVSGTLVHHTKVGDSVRLGHAEGAMGLSGSSDRDLLMIAGDTGVAPLKALLTELADTGDPRSAVLFWGVRNLDELYDIAEITEIARAAKRATVVPVISEGNPGPYASGLVTDAVAAYGEWSDCEVYLAGPPLMLAATRAALLELGVAADRIHHDPPE